MKISLRTKMALSFLLVVAVLFGLISLSANVLLDRQFEAYVMEQQEEDNQAVVELVSGSYQNGEGTWDLTELELIGTNALDNGLMLRIEDFSGSILWDAMAHNKGRCNSILKEMSNIMKGYHKNFSGGYTEKQYSVLLDGQSVGTVYVGYYGPYFYTESDMRFLDTLNRLLLIGGILAMIFALGLGLWMASQLSKPIKRVTAATRQIADGNLEERVKRQSTTAEIIELTGAVNDMAETLEKQEILRKRLTADVAHELRTPLATLQSHLEAMMDGVWEPDTARLRLCHDETIRLTGIVKNLEELTKYDQENIHLELTCLELDELLLKVAKTFEAEAQRKEIDLDVSKVKAFQTAKIEPMDIEGDWNKLTQVFVNLMANSLKYTPEGGKITLGLAISSDEVCITVQDTGTGIPETDLPYIFERFFRADVSRNKKTGGSGIGLAIVKSIIGAHQGKINVASKPGQGTLFTIHLPHRQDATTQTDR